MSWIKDKLGTLTEIISGTTPNSGTNAYWDGSNIWITSTDLGKLDNINIISSERRLTDKGIKDSNLKIIPTNSVVMSSRAPIGHLGLSGVELYTNQGCKSFVCNAKLNPLYLYYYLKYRMKDIQDLGSGSTFLEVSKSSLENFEIRYPESLSDQISISSKLREQFSELEKARKAMAIQLKEIDNLANAIIYESIRKNETHKHSLTDVLDEVKKGIGANWKDHPVFGATRAGIALAKEPPGKKPQSYKPVVAGTVFYNPMRILIGSIAFADDEDVTGITSPDYVVLQGKKGILDSRWFYYWLRSPLGQQCISSLARGAVRERMLFNRLAEGEIILPDYAIQAEASKALKNLKPVRAQLKKQLDEIAAIPNKLLSNIFQEA
jgi:type I restriction enzyme S subunit